MNFLIYGAGAVGCYVGAKLMNDGHGVTLITRRPGQADLLNQQGLTLTENEEKHHVQPEMLTSIRLAFQNRTYDAIFLAMKSYDVPEALNPLIAFCPNPPPIITLQNGIGIEEFINNEFGGCEIIAGSLTTPVIRNTPERIVVEREDRGLALAPTAEGQSVKSWVALLNQTGLTTVAIRDYQAMKWSKALLNMIGNASSAILNRHPSVIYKFKPTFRMEMAMLKETLAVMRGRNIKVVDLPGTSAKRLAFAVRRLPSGLVQSTLTKRVSEGRGNKMPSFHIDLSSGRANSEVIYHNGAIAKAGQDLNIPTPINTALTDILLKLIRREINWEIYNGNPQQLVNDVMTYKNK